MDAHGLVVLLGVGAERQWLGSRFNVLRPVASGVVQPVADRGERVDDGVELGVALAVDVDPLEERIERPLDRPERSLGADEPVAEVED